MHTNGLVKTLFLWFVGASLVLGAFGELTGDSDNATPIAVKVGAIGGDGSNGVIAGVQEWGQQMDQGGAVKGNGGSNQ